MQLHLSSQHIGMFPSCSFTRCVQVYSEMYAYRSPQQAVLEAPGIISQDPAAAQVLSLHQQHDSGMLQLPVPHVLSQNPPQDSAQHITESGLEPQTDGHMGVLQQDLTHQLTEAGSGPQTDGQTEVLHQELTQQLIDSGSCPQDLSQQLTDSGSGPQTLQVEL